MDKIIVYVSSFFTLIALYRAFIAKFAAVHQQCGYRAGEYLPCLKKSLAADVETILVCVVFGTAFSVSSLAARKSSLIALLGFFMSVALAVLCDRSTEIKMKAKPTFRFVRIHIVGFILWAAFPYTAAFLLERFAVINFAYTFFPSAFAWAVLLPLAPVAATFILSPYDAAKYRRYIKAAGKKLDNRPDLIKIAVTGSCGKTTVKNYLRELLSLKYEVLTTPESYNTPLGICISLKGLKDNTQIFVAEMGARKTGDISELCGMVKPDIAVITGITAQHLETFESVDNIIKEKGEVVRAVGKNGFAVISADTKGSLEIYVGAECEKVLAGINARAAIRAENIKFSAVGTKFILINKDKKYTVSAPFFGRHNVTDFLIAFAVGEKLGVPVGRMIAAARRLTPPKHRFSVTKTAAGVTVIDDGYNANIEGVKSGIECLSCFDGRKIVVTAGIAECGDESEKLNREAGKIISATADMLIAVGRFADFVLSGVSCEKCETQKVATLAAAQEILKNSVKAGDNVMFINDLPDRY